MESRRGQLARPGSIRPEGQIEQTKRDIQRDRRLAAERAARPRLVPELLLTSDALLGALEELNLAEVRHAPPEVTAAARRLLLESGRERIGTTVQALLDAVLEAQESLLEEARAQRRERRWHGDAGHRSGSETGRRPDRVMRLDPSRAG
ncbi:MAG: hypothetical protein WAM30_09920 [Candidatus Dormiibacterota bacterium]